MSSTIACIIEHLARQIDAPGLPRQPWYLIPGRAGPNAVLKIIFPSGESPSCVVTVARHPDTHVVRHEAEVIRRLHEILPAHLQATLPTILATGRSANRDYFAIPYYRTVSHGRFARVLYANRRWNWVRQWLTEFALATRGQPLDREHIAACYGPTVDRIQVDPAVSAHVKEVVSTHFEQVRDHAHEIPRVCCHGDIWAGNLFWQDRCRHAMVLDWGAATWTGLPAVEFCRCAAAGRRSHTDLQRAIAAYCQAVGLNDAIVPALFDMYNVFIKTELDAAFAFQPHESYDPFKEQDLTPAERLFGRRNASIGATAHA